MGGVHRRCPDTAASLIAGEEGSVPPCGARTEAKAPEVPKYLDGNRFITVDGADEEQLLANVNTALNGLRSGTVGATGSSPIAGSPAREIARLVEDGRQRLAEA